LENIFKPIFSKQKEIQYGRLESFLNIPTNLKYLFEESSKNLNESQKQKNFCFVKNFLMNFIYIFGRHYCWELWDRGTYNLICKIFPLLNRCYGEF